MHLQDYVCYHRTLVLELRLRETKHHPENTHRKEASRIRQQTHTHTCMHTHHYLHTNNIIYTVRRHSLLHLCTANPHIACYLGNETCSTPGPVVRSHHHAPLQSHMPCPHEPMLLGEHSHAESVIHMKLTAQIKRADRRNSCMVRATPH